MSERPPLDITLTVNGERVRERVDARKTLVDFLRDDLGADRQPRRLRARRVRRLHGAGRWRDRARLPDAGSAMRRRRRSRPSRASPTPARSPTCRRRSSSATRCSAASARPACCSPRGSAARKARAEPREIREHFPATTAAAPAITPSSTRLKRWRGAAGARLCTRIRNRACGCDFGSGSAGVRMRGKRQTMKIVDDVPARAHRARPAELLYRPLGAAAESRAADARARAICQRRRAAAHGACRLRALAARACAHRRRSTTDDGEEGARRDRGRHRRRARQGDDAVGRRADASQGPEIGAAARRSRSSAPAGRARPCAPWSRARAPRPRTPASWSTSTYEELPAVTDAGDRARSARRR